MNANTSTEGNGKKELKVRKTNDADKLIDNFFADYINVETEEEKQEGYEYVLSTHALNFTAKDQAVKSQIGEDNEVDQNIIGAINVLENGRRDFVLEEIAKGAGLNIKLAELKKVKAKTDKIRKEKAAKKEAENEKKNSAGGTDRESR